MKLAHPLAAVLSSAFFSLAFAQTPPISAPVQDPAATQAPSQASPPAGPQLPDNQRPLTPAEQREKTIRKYDPLDRNAPANGASGSGSTDQNNNNGRPASAATSAPLPGSIAASSQGDPTNPRSDGPTVLSENGDAIAAQDYSGPAVLSRSYTLSRPGTSQTVKWSPFVGIAEVYDSGETGVPGAGSGFGYAASWGLTGRHFWKRDQIGINYFGNYNHAGGNAFNGSNQTFNLDYAHAFSKRLALHIVSSASSYSASYTIADPGLLQSGGSLANISLGISPGIQALDQGTRQLTNQVSTTWQKSARLSFNVGGGAFFVQRTGQGIFGNSGTQAQFDMNYRYSRRGTVGLYYTFTEYAYSKQTNSANFHTLGGIYSYSFGKTLQFRSRLGISRLESTGQELVQISPIVAALTGQSQGIIQFYNRDYTSDISAELIKDFGRKRSGNISYARGISPGNGLLLTSIQESYSASFTESIRRNYRLVVIAGRTALSASGLQNFANYNTQYVSADLSHTYRYGLTGDLRFDYRKYSVSGQPMLLNELRISTGFTWGPPDNWMRRYF